MLAVAATAALPTNLAVLELVNIDAAGNFLAVLLADRLRRNHEFYPIFLSALFSRSSFR